MWMQMVVLFQFLVMVMTQKSLLKGGIAIAISKNVFALTPFRLTSRKVLQHFCVFEKSLSDFNKMIFIVTRVAFVQRSSIESSKLYRQQMF